MSNLIEKNSFIINTIAFIIILSMFNLYYKPSFTLSRIAFVLFVLWDFYKNKRIRIPKIDRNLLVGSSIFLGIVLLESIISSSIANIHGSIDLIEHILPFIMLCYLREIGNINKGIIAGLGLVLAGGLVLSLIEFFCFGIQRPNSLLKNPNNWAWFVAMTLPVFAYGVFISKKHRLLYSLFSFIGLFSLLLAQSRGAIIAVIFTAIVIVLYMLLKNNIINMKQIICFIFIFALCLFFAKNVFIALGSRSYDLERLLVYKAAINMWLDNPVFGVGFGMWPELYLSTYKLANAKESLFHSHNIYLHVLSSSGIVGFSAFIFFLWTCFKSVLKNERFYWLVGVSGLIICLVQEITDATLMIRYCGRAFWLLLFVYQYNIFESEDSK